MESCESLLRGSRQLAGSFFDFEDLIPIAIGYELRHMAADIRAQGQKGTGTLGRTDVRAQRCTSVICANIFVP